MPLKVKRYRKYSKSKKSKDAKQDMQIKQIKKILPRPELKIVQNPAFPPAGVVGVSQVGPQIILLNALAQGTAEGQRIGNTAKMIKLQLNIQLRSTATAPTNTMRVLLIKQKRPVGALISLVTIFGVATPYTWYLFNEPFRDWKSGYQILLDRKMYVDFANGYNATANMNIRKKLNFLTDYSRGNAGTIADIDTNAVYLVIITDNPAASQQYAYHSHLFYADN